MLTVAQIHSQGRRGDIENLLGVTDTSLDDQDSNIGVLSKTASNGIASCAAANNDKVKACSV